MADPNPTPPPQQGSTPPSGDMSQYIRTYAKDVAKLTDQPAPVVPKPQEEKVSLPEVDPSPINRPGGIAKDFKQETVTLTKEDSAGIFARPQTPAAVPPPTPAPVPAPPPNDFEKREEVLARLRQKVAEHQALTPEPVPPPPPQAPTPISKPTFSPFPPAPPQPVPPPPPPPPMPPIGVVPADTGPSPLHTYTSDFANQIDEKQASPFTVLAAQSDTGVRTETRTTKSKTAVLPVVLAVLLIIVGVGGLYAAYQFISSGEKPQVTLGVPSLILADEKMELKGPNYRQNLADAALQPLVDGNILVTYVATSSTTPLGLQSEPQPGGALVRLLNLGAPDILFRNVDLSSTVGVVSAGGETSPFFIFRVNSYERTFAGMLNWERNGMLADLDPLYPQYSVPIPESVSTTTVSEIISQPPELFTDAVVSNTDVRLLKDSSGRTLIIYGYSDKDTLIIARNEAAFVTLVARLNATRGGE